jgi:hypothetical protein
LLELLRPQGPRDCGHATAEDLRAAAALAFRHGLFLLVDRAVREHAGLLPAGLAANQYEATARPLRLRHISHGLIHERAQREVLALLAAAAVPSVVLKGPALSEELFGEPHCRTSADIDIAVRPRDVAAADAALRGAGYRRDDDLPLAFWMRRLHHAVYRRPGSSVPVELHWNFSIPGFFNLEPEQIWANVELDGLSGQLNRPMAMTLLLMHHHLHGCAELRTLVDLAWAFDRNRDELLSDSWVARLETTGLLVVEGVARRQVNKLWGAQRGDCGGDGGRHALRVAFLAGAAGRVLRPGRKPRASDRCVRALVHRLGLDSPRRVVGAIAKTLLPAAADVRALTGEQRVGPAGYVRYFKRRFGGRAAGSARAGRALR